EALDCPRSLTVLAQPIGEALRTVLRKRSSQRQHGPRNRKLVREGKRRGFQKGERGMQGRWQGARTNFRSPPPRLDEHEPVKPLNLFRGADSLIEIEQIGAAAQQHMLA